MCFKHFVCTLTLEMERYKIQVIMLCLPLAVSLYTVGEIAKEGMMLLLCLPLLVSLDIVGRSP